MTFKNNEEKLKHIGLMCASNLHDAFRNMGDIASLAGNGDFHKHLSDKEKLALIKKKADETYSIFRVIERIRHQNNNTKVNTFKISDFIEKIRKYYDREIRHNTLEFVMLCQDYELTCKKGLLYQILINLIHNSTIHTTVEYDKRKTIVTFDGESMTVSDNGGGVAEEIKDKIFDLFFTTKDLDKLSGENNGIGLYGVKENIKELGYKITVENNTILCGANFKITF